MLSKEEKKAIEELNRYIKEKDSIHGSVLETIASIIEKQQAEIQQLEEDMSNMYDEKVVRNILEDECGLSKYEIDEILN